MWPLSIQKNTRTYSDKKTCITTAVDKCLKEDKYAEKRINLVPVSSYQEESSACLTIFLISFTFTCQIFDVKLLQLYYLTSVC